MAKVNLHPDFREFLKSLNSTGVKYLLVGGYAVIYYGYRRVTDDLDVWIALDPDNTEKVSKVLQAFGGFRPAQVKASMFRQPGKVFAFGREPVRIDVLTAPSGVDFEKSYSRRTEIKMDGIKVPVIGFEDLKRNKRASGRAKDLADIENLPPRFRGKAPRKRRRKPKR